MGKGKSYKVESPRKKEKGAHVLRSGARLDPQDKCVLSGRDTSSLCSILSQSKRKKAPVNGGPVGYTVGDAGAGCSEMPETPAPQNLDAVGGRGHPAGGGSPPPQGAELDAAPPTWGHPSSHQQVTPQGETRAGSGQFCSFHHSF